MSMHQADYEQLAFTLFGWFAQARQSGQSSEDALKNVAVTALSLAVQRLEPSAPQPQQPPVTGG
jgi:hypothetical protein